MPGVIKVHRTGDASVLSWEDEPITALKPGQIQIRHKAIGVNFIDVYHRAGQYPQPLPFVPGVEGAGIVEALGPNVTGFELGDRVAYVGPIGAYAEERAITADRVLKLPDEISFEVAAASLLRGMTAHVLLQQTYPVAKGDFVLVHAAAGGTGLILCEWAAALGATVVGTVSTEEKASAAFEHGCHFPIVHGKQDFVEEVRRITKGKMLPVVYDSVGRDTFHRSLDCLRTRGLMVAFGQSSGAVEPIAPTLLAQKGSLYLTRPSLFHYIEDRGALEAASRGLFDMMIKGKISIAVNQRFSLQDAAKAHTELERRATTGSTVLIA
jgi:NADPH2:quinone reductase